MAKIKLYKKDPCPYCDRALNFLKERNLEVEIVDLTSKPEEIERIKNETGWMTVPIIMINDKLIGGYSDLRSLEEEGKLAELLK